MIFFGLGPNAAIFLVFLGAFYEQALRPAAQGLIFSEMSLAAGIPHALADASRRDIAELCPTVVTRESGRFSIPEMLAMESRGRSVQDTPHARGMTTPC